MDRNSAVKKILLVEDDDISQFLLKKMIEDQGYELTIIDNGVSALELLENVHFDLIIMDIEMPIISGIEATRRIRSMQNPVKAQVPIIGISANPFESADDFIQKGMSDYIIKPVDEAVFVFKMKTFLYM